MRRIAWVIAVLLVGCAPRHRPRPAAPTGVNHHIEDTFKALVSTKALDKVIPPGWKFEKFASGADSVTVGFQDTAGAMHSVDLLLKPPADTKVQGKGKNFSFRISATESADDTRSLVEAARVVDSLTSIEALVAEPLHPPQPKSFIDQLKSARAPVVIALGAVQSLIVAGAILVALLTGRTRRSDEVRTSYDR